jgi:HD-GYP domain-containing protein (c-di-GMP phosphodiesterase class II)
LFNKNLLEIAGATIEMGPLPFDIISVDENSQYYTYLEKDSQITNRVREDLLSTNSRLFIKQADHSSYLDYVFIRIERIVASKFLNEEIKADLVFKTGNRLIKEIYKDPTQKVSCNNFGRFIKNYIDLMLYSKKAAGKLLQLSSVSSYQISHSLNTSTFCMLLGQKIYDSNRIRLWELGMGGAYLDIGMSQIDPMIFKKKGKLSSMELSMVKKHSQIGKRILERLELDPQIQRMCYFHHERYDGTGYPDGLMEHDIPEYARIAAVADVYDALTSDRDYKQSEDHVTALISMYSQAGKFDPHILETLVRVVLKSEKLVTTFLEMHRY